MLRSYSKSIVHPGCVARALPSSSPHRVRTYGSKLLRRGGKVFRRRVEVGGNE